MVYCVCRDNGKENGNYNLVHWGCIWEFAVCEIMLLLSLLEGERAALKFVRCNNAFNVVLSPVLRTSLRFSGTWVPEYGFERQVVRASSPSGLLHIAFVPPRTASIFRIQSLYRACAVLLAFLYGEKYT